MPAEAEPPVVTHAIPCRADEPRLGITLEAALARWRETELWGRTAIYFLVCINGPGAASCAPLEALAETMAGAEAPLAAFDLDSTPSPPLPGPAIPLTAVALTTERAGKARAWNHLWRLAPSEVVLVSDADVTFGPGAFARLLACLAEHPDAALVSPRTACVAGQSLVGRLGEAPYGVEFPNLSGQLYIMRRSAVPPRMPEDLIEPERWLELSVGPQLVARERRALVYVRPPATLADFFRQRIRIEMGKVQLAVDYPALLARSRPQPGLAATLRALHGGALVRLGAYLALRSVAHAVAWFLYRAGHTAGVWRQAATTKAW